MNAVRTSRPFYGFYIVAACFFILFMLWGMVLNTFPIFLKPITEDMGWGRGALAVALLAGSLGAAVAGPVAGMMMDRMGARPVMLAGAITIGLALLAGSRIALLWQLYAVFAVIGCGLMCGTIIPCSLLISNWFISRRGTAMGGAFVGTSVGGMVMSPVANWIILDYGWRTAFAFSGLTILVLVTPVILLVIRTRPSEMGLEPYRHSEAGADGADDDWGVSARQALSLWVFWQIGVIMLLVALVTSGLGNHCVAYLSDLGHSPTRAAFAWSVVMGAMTVGKLSTGPISDRWGAKNTMAGACVLLSLSIAILVFAQPYWVVLAFAGVYGFAVGTPLIVNPLLTSKYLGMRNFGAVYGVLNAVSTLGAAAGPVGAGIFFDSQGTYLPVFYVFIALMLVAAVFSALVKPAS
ncbi:MAG: MFS transporter [Deltaproteobacteria bacterium]|nr:MFS transporter [Deltaproteobacteria bacterium]